MAPTTKENAADRQNKAVDDLRAVAEGKFRAAKINPGADQSAANAAAVKSGRWPTGRDERDRTKVHGD
jgi:hypothetical protein